VILLDTNVISEFSKPAVNEAVLGWFRRQDLLTLHLCAPVVMEQTYGARRFQMKTGSDRFTRLTQRLFSETFAGRILPFDEIAAIRTGHVRAERDRAGRPIGVIDAMIAAICLVHDAILATRNIRDFDGLDLKLVNPFEAMA
jgi:toxin FitB